MRGISEKQAVMLSLITPENRVPKYHPLRHIKVIGGFRKTRFKGELRIQLAGCFVGAAYDLLGMGKLLPQGAAG
jgi:hypothetical protein